MSKFEIVQPSSLRDRDEWVGTLTFTSKDFEAIYQDHGPDCKIMKVIESISVLPGALNAVRYLKHYYARGKKADRLAARWFFVGCVEGLVR